MTEDHRLHDQYQDDGTAKPQLRCSKESVSTTFNTRVKSLLVQKIDYCPFCGDKIELEA